MGVKGTCAAWTAQHPIPKKATHKPLMLWVGQNFNMSATTVAQHAGTTPWDTAPDCAGCRRTSSVRLAAATAPATALHRGHPSTGHRQTPRHCAAHSVRISLQVSRCKVIPLCSLQKHICSWAAPAPARTSHSGLLANTQQCVRYHAVGHRCTQNMQDETHLRDRRRCDSADRPMPEPKVRVRSATPLSERSTKPGGRGNPGPACEWHNVPHSEHRHPMCRGSAAQHSAAQHSPVSTFSQDRFCIARACA